MHEDTRFSAIATLGATMTLCSVPVNSKILLQIVDFTKTI